MAKRNRREIRVLLVDDNPLLREKLKKTLQTYFMNSSLIKLVFFEANDGKEGLEKFLENNGNFDAIITGQNMPNVTGISFVEKIWEQIKTQNIILVFWTHLNSQEFKLAIEQLRKTLEIIVFNKSIGLNDLKRLFKRLLFERGKITEKEAGSWGNLSKVETGF